MSRSSRKPRKTAAGLKHADTETGLIPGNLNRNKDIWNASDSADDNYPFMVLTAAITDRSAEGGFDGRMLDMLRSEKHPLVQ